MQSASVATNKTNSLQPNSFNERVLKRRPAREAGLAQVGGEEEEEWRGGNDVAETIQPTPQSQ